MTTTFVIFCSIIDTRFIFTCHPSRLIHTLFSSTSQVDEPPVFSITTFNITTFGVGTAGLSIWQPLSAFVTNPDAIAPFNTITFRLVQGPCALGLSTEVTVPVSIGTTNGSLYYTVSGPLGNYPSPFLLCVLAIDGGGLSSTADVSVWFAAVQQQLSVLPAIVNVTHYSPGTSVVPLNVFYSPGSHANTNWTVSMPQSQWCSAFVQDDSTLVIQVNSHTIATGDKALFTTSVTVASSGGFIACCGCTTMILSVCVCRPMPQLSAFSCMQMGPCRSLCQYPYSLALATLHCQHLPSTS